MALNNAYKMYTALVKEHTPERRFLSMGDAVRELTHDLCQRGPAMRKLRAEHPSWTRDLGKLFGWVTGRKVRSDAKGMMTVMPACLPVEVAMNNYALLKNQQRKSPWRMHQSEAVAKQGKCGWDDCPGKLASKAKYPRNSDTHMRCEECSARWLRQGSAGELPPALPHLSSHQRICIDDGNKLISINLSKISQIPRLGVFLRG
jgi:hypothetical protein